MEQCESAASLLASVREQEVQFERLTRALEEERRRVGHSSPLPRPLPTPQVMLPFLVRPQPPPQLIHGFPSFYPIASVLAP